MSWPWAFVIVGLTAVLLGYFVCLTVVDVLHLRARAEFERAQAETERARSVRPR